MDGEDARIRCWASGVELTRSVEHAIDALTGVEREGRKLFRGTVAGAESMAEDALRHFDTAVRYAANCAGRLVDLSEFESGDYRIRTDVTSYRETIGKLDSLSRRLDVVVEAAQGGEIPSNAHERRMKEQQAERMSRFGHALGYNQ